MKKNSIGTTNTSTLPKIRQKGRTGMENISNAEYRKKEGISSSDLKKMMKSMASFKYYKEHPEDSDSEALQFGRAYHKLMLEPEDFDKEFIVFPKIDRRSKEGKEAYAGYLKKAEGKEILSSEDFEKL